MSLLAHIQLKGVITSYSIHYTKLYELCNKLKKTTETTHIPIILLTAKGNVESIKEGYTYGADDYIVKPFNSQIFQTRIRNLLDIRKQLRSYFTQKGEFKRNNFV